MLLSVCEMTYTTTAIVAMQQTESDKIVGRSQMNMLHDMLRTCYGHVLLDLDIRTCILRCR